MLLRQLGRYKPYLVGKGLRRGANLSSAVAPTPTIGLDIGGSLTKAVIHVPDGWKGLPDAEEAFLRAVRAQMPRHPGYEPHLQLAADGGEYSFLRFETRWMEDFFDILEKLGAKGAISAVNATGGGAFKYRSICEERLGVQLLPVDEMQALAMGFARFLSMPVETSELYGYDLHATPGSKEELIPMPGSRPDRLPAILVSIGSGVSLIQVDEGTRTPLDVQRVNGSSIGGATFWGLCRLLTKFQSFDEAVQALEKGDNNKVAMLVKHIYGGDYSKLGLPGDIVASDFGRIGVRAHPRFENTELGEPEVCDADLVRGLMVLVLNNVAQVAFMTAERENIDRVFFTGAFLRQGLMMRTLTSALRFWSMGSVAAGFMRHEAFFGAMGALLEARPSPPASALHTNNFPPPPDRSEN